jgi:SagB-type dehydrogenase family enzyme
MDESLKKNRFFLKDHFRMMIDFRKTDQRKGLEPPAIQKPYPKDASLVNLTKPEALRDISNMRLYDIIDQRRSRRAFSPEPLCIKDISFLLWATQGIRRVLNPAVALRNVPSAGARHSFETYLCIINVESLEQGLFRYLPIEHKLLRLSEDNNLAKKVIQATFGQTFCGQAAVVFIWTAVPYRMEWRYGLAAHKVIAIDAGHVCQNLYLACEALGLSTCAVGAYHQQEMDELVGVDGEDEFAIYLAPVGRRSSSPEQ